LSRLHVHVHAACPCLCWTSIEKWWFGRLKKKT
jgi:hypothetical protein